MNAVKLLIIGNLETGEVQLAGPVADMPMMHWLLGEARRLCEREATKREAAASKPPLIIAPDVRRPIGRG